MGTLLVATLLLAACEREAAPQDDAAAKLEQELSPVGLLGTMLEGMVEVPRYRREARELPTAKLLADLAASKSWAAGAPGHPPAAIAELERRLAVDLPADAELILSTPGAASALHWLEPAAMNYATQLGDALGSRLNLDEADWAEARVLVENMDGGGWRIRAGDLREYVVVVDGIFGQLVLYDLREPPAHPCCRLVESPLLKSDTPTAHADLRTWLEIEWALSRSTAD